MSMYVLTFAFIAMGFLKQRLKSKAILDTDKEYRNFSIIIPFRNEEKNIINCLESLIKLDYPNDCFEIILVNDHSEDEGLELVSQFKRDHQGADINVLELGDDQGKKKALSFGVSESRFDYIITTDADCTVQAKWLESLNEAYYNDASMIVSPVQFTGGSSFLAGLQTLDMFALQGTGLGSLAWRMPAMNNGANLSYRKKDFLKVGGYDELRTPSGDDIFLMEKFQQEGFPIESNISRKGVVFTPTEDNWSDFIQQRIRWASKSGYYKNKWMIYLGFLVAVQQLFVLFFYVGALLVEKYWMELLFLLFCKWLIDFILLFLVASFFKKKRSMFYFSPVQLLSPIYAIVIGIASLTVKYEWKGRSFNG